MTMSQEQAGQQNKPRRIKKSIYILGLVVAFLALAGFGGWSYYNYRQAQTKIAGLMTEAGQVEVAKKEIEMLLSSVKKHMLLPENENPTIATVTDADALKKDQPFFEKAQNGDKVIIYSGAKKAIIYNPTDDIVVNVGAVTLDEGQQQQQSASIDEGAQKEKNE